MAELVVYASDDVRSCGISKVTATYAETHDADDGDTVYVAEGGQIMIHNSLEGSDYRIDRGYLTFDTSALGASAQITSASLSLLGCLGMVGYHNVETDPGQATLHIVEGVHGDIVVVADFGLLRAKTTSGGSIAFGNWVADDWNTIVLNATGRGWISKTGMTKFGLRLSGDIDSEIPTGGNNLYMYASTSPYLTIVYTAGPSYKGNINLDQLIYQHAERMERFR